ncbi:hypothetical protein [Zhongshania sp.]
MTIEPLTQNGWSVFVRFKGRKFVTECESPELCWTVARAWMSDVVGEGVL